MDLALEEKTSKTFKENVILTFILQVQNLTSLLPLSRIESCYLVVQSVDAY